MTTKTYRLHAGSFDRAWHVIDAQGKPLGRVASEAAKLLLGKHKPTYEPHLPMGDFVVIVNAKEVGYTGNKATTKVYYRHSGYPGGLRERTLEEQLTKDPRRVIEKAVKGMLPGNVLGRELFRHLKVYSGPNHPHAAQLRAGMGAAKRTSVPSTSSQGTSASAAATAAPAASTPAPSEAESAAEQSE